MADRIQWGGNRKKAFTDFIHHDLERAITQRKSIEQDWRKWLEQYRAPADQGVAHFPFEGASNITYPLTAMNVDPIWARFMQNIHAADNMWTLSPLNERWINASKPLQDYMSWLDRHILHMWDVNMRVFPEAIKLGTSIYKTHWIYQRRRKVGYDQNKQRARFVETINRPAVDHVSIANFYLPPEAREIDPDTQGGAQWVSERFRLRRAELKAMAEGQEPFLPNFTKAAVDEVLKFEEQAPTDHEQKISKLENIDATYSLMHTRPIEIWEVHARFDTSGNGIEDDIVIFYHKPSNTVLRGTYEPFGTRPYSAIRYLRGEGFYGVGMGEQLEMWQDTISNVLNYNIDKILLSNAPMIRAQEGANILPNEPIFPGKVWFAGKDEIEPFFLTTNASIDINVLFGSLQDGSKQRSGITDLQFGNVGSMPSRTPATTIQSLLQEGNTRFDMSMKDVRTALGDVGLRVLQNIQAQAGDVVNNPEGADYLKLAIMVLGEPEGQYAAQALNIPFESIELGIGVNLTATSGANNKELLRQSNLALLQLYGQLGPQFIQLAQIVTQFPGTPMATTAEDLFKGGRELMLRVFEQFDVRNPEELIPNVQALLSAQGAVSGGQSISPMANQGAGSPPSGVTGV